MSIFFNFDMKNYYLIDPSSTLLLFADRPDLVTLSVFLEERTTGSRNQ